MSPTLVLMLKAPAAGAVKTRLAATVGAARATEIYRSLVERQVRALPEGWPVVICFDPPEAGAAMRAWLTPLRPKGTEFCTQGAGDLGRRLTLAAAAAFGAGAQAVVLIGGDCPYLAHTHLAEAATALRGERVVLGPARDGGYYLIGLHRPEPAVFHDIAWSSPQVLVQTRSRCRSAGLDVHELPELEDVDDEMSWRRAVEAGALR
jgi:hypothetical protein